MNKKIMILCNLVLVAFIFLSINFSNLTVNAVQKDSYNIINEYKDEQGQTVQVFDDGVQVTILEDGSFIVLDYYNSLEQSKPIRKERSGWIVLGKVLIKAIGVCSTLDYVSGYDVCRIAINYLKTTAKPNVKYQVTGRYISGYIPGCEPRYSGTCNRGYWEYRVVPL